jgi:hypothetical protein
MKVRASCAPRTSGLPAINVAASIARGLDVASAKLSNSHVLLPNLPNVYSAPRCASAIKLKSHIQLTEHAHHAGSMARTMQHATASCWNDRLQYRHIITNHNFLAHIMNDTLPTPCNSLTNQAGGSNLGYTRAKRG